MRRKLRKLYAAYDRKKWQGILDNPVGLGFPRMKGKSLPYSRSRRDPDRVIGMLSLLRFQNSQRQ